MNPLFGRIAPGRTARWNLLVDMVGVALALWGSMALTGGTWISPELHTRVAACLAVWIIASSALRHYDPWANERDILDDTMMVTVLCFAVATVVFCLNLLASGSVPVPRTLQTTLLLWPLVLGFRVFVFRQLSRTEGPLDEVLVVGTGPLGRLTGQDLMKGARRRVLGYLSFPDEARPENLRNQYLGASSELDKLLKSMPVSEVYICGDMLKRGESMQQAIQACEKLGIPFALPLSSFRFERARPVAGKLVSDGYVHYSGMDLKPQQMALKRLFDIASSAAALWVLMPVLAAIAIAIKLTSRGPVFFKQVRTGLHGKSFHMLKFRSMVVDAEALKAALEKQNEQSGPVFKMTNDPRVTRIGRFIRKYSLDELPQLVNVLRGDMSVVGPRPPVPSEVVKYEPWQRRRLSVRPGLTCIWQVSGRNQISFEQWMYLDMQYIDHWSLGQDLSLIFKTFPVVLTGRGAS